MSLHLRLARPTLAVGRAYSSFFSSKPGGGRHLIPPKHVDSDNAQAKAVDEKPAEPSPIHPTLSSKEYRLHQFFSLHRPLLLLNQPTSAIFEPADPSTPLCTSSEEFACYSPPPFATIDNPLESSPDADADMDAARQLAHSLVLNRVGGAVAWQQVLSRLGLTTLDTENDISLAKQSAHEWVSIHADSTRRKKRKKMKKHKLKKRRRLTRRQNK